MQGESHVMRSEENLLSIPIRNLSIRELDCRIFCPASFRPEGIVRAFRSFGSEPTELRLMQSTMSQAEFLLIYQTQRFANSYIPEDNEEFKSNGKIR
jgi:hypothetical protein